MDGHPPLFTHEHGCVITFLTACRPEVAFGNDRVKPSSREGATAVTPKGGALVAQIQRELLLNLAGRCHGHLPRGAPR
jgi:hypothetical protein